MNFYTVPSVIIGKPATHQVTVAAVNTTSLRVVSENLWRVGDLATFVDPITGTTLYQTCLLYTSDAADE